VDGDEERELRDLLKRMDEWKAEPERRSAVLLAAEENGTLVGAWNREGAKQSGNETRGAVSPAASEPRSRHTGPEHPAEPHSARVAQAGTAGTAPPEPAL
jgi:hypothetical protein